MNVKGKVSQFGGPHDAGLARGEGLALIEQQDIYSWWFRYLFLRTMDSTRGLAQNLNPFAFFIACRWNYDQTSRALLRRSVALVCAHGRSCFARPVDWGPNENTGRAIDCSEGLMRELSLITGDVAEVFLMIPHDG